MMGPFGVIGVNELYCQSIDLLMIYTCILHIYVYIYLYIYTQYVLCSIWVFCLCRVIHQHIYWFDM